MWQPIETAPTDGAEVFLWGTLEWTPQSRPHVGCEEMHRAYWSEISGAWVALGGSDGYVIDPTHWMPLPPPPTASDASVGHND